MSVMIVLFLSGCFLAEPIIKKPPPEIMAKQNVVFLENIKKCALDGDWLVTRGYHVSDALVANATATPISHAGVYDKNALEVIEAESGGIHTTKLDEFVAKSHRIIVIRPRWSTEETRGKALANARNLIGKGYDFAGTVGLNMNNRYYCSELVVHVYKQWQKKNEKLPIIIKPSELYLWGKVLYDTLPRN